MYRKIHFTGIGGVGMCALAHIAMDLGCQVSGSDVVDSANLEGLRERGAQLAVGHFPALPEGTELLVYSAAVPENDAERRLAAGLVIPQLRRGHFLNELAKNFDIRIAISGSHGKTSTSAMLAHILKFAGMNPGYLVGGAVAGWQRPGAAGDGRILISEVDESDGSQAGFPATIAVVLNIDDDHSWGLGGEEGLEKVFTDLTSQANKIIACSGEVTSRLYAKCAEFVDEPLPLALNLPLPGRHGRLNGAVALRIAECLGVARDTALQALDCFPGVGRRMTLRWHSQDFSQALLEDYAHHPTELAATIQAIREQYPAHRLYILFQPHRIERVERYGERFAKLLSTVERSWLVETFSAWRTDGKTANVQANIADLVKTPCSVLPNEPQVIANAVLAEWPDQKPSVLAVIGAGDVNKAIPLLIANCR